MPVNLIDLATMAPRSQEASQTHMNQMHQNEAAAAQMVTGFEHTVQKDSHKPVETNKDEMTDYKREHSGGNAYQQQQNKQKKNKEEKMAPRSTSQFDVTI